VAALGGELEVAKFKTNGWTDFEFFGATPLSLNAGDGQEFTLCFEKAAWLMLGTVCIAATCPLS
jgi:hypothetical protein